MTQEQHDTHARTKSARAHTHTQTHQHTHTHTCHKSSPTHLADAGDFLLGIFETLWTHVVAFHELLPHVLSKFSALVSLLDKVTLPRTSVS
jgi:hypothetical protein